MAIGTNDRTVSQTAPIYLASGSGRIWNFTALLREPGPVSSRLLKNPGIGLFS